MVKFSKRWTIDEAYRRLTSSIEEKVLTFGDLPRLQRACIREIKALGSNLPNKLIPQIQVTSSVNGLLDTLTNSEYWNWFDTRLLTAVTQASGSPEAIKSLEKYKAVYYSRKVSDLILCEYKIKPFKNFVPVVEKYKKDPSKLTILDLQKHQYEIEQVVEGGLALIEIKTGCVELTWQIPQELVYRAYTSMKRKQDELSSLAVKSLVCKEADELAGLPILWRGQEIGEVGPIKPLPEHVRQEPYSLPQGFHWVTLNSSNAEEVVKFTNKCRNPELIFSDDVKYIFMHPNTINEWHFGIRASNGKLVAVTLGNSVCINIGEVSITCIYPIITYCPKYRNKRLWYMLVKELMRRANLNNINHLLFSFYSANILKPINTTHIWSYSFNDPTSSQLPSSPRTPGWRRMTSEDVPSALALINKWSSQFEIKRVFNFEEFTHTFLYSTVANSVLTYVMENDTNNITDLVSYRLLHKSSLHVFANVTTVVSTKSPIKQLITDMLVCVKKTCTEVFGCCPKELILSQCNIEPDVLSSLSFQYKSDHVDYFIYNYRYNEIPEARFWFVEL